MNYTNDASLTKQKITNPSKIFERAQLIVSLLVEGVVSRKTEPNGERKYEVYDHNGIESVRWCFAGKQFYLRPDATHRLENRREYADTVGLINSLMIPLLYRGLKFRYPRDRRTLLRVSQDCEFLLLSFVRRHSISQEEIEMNLCYSLKKTLMKYEIKQSRTGFLLVKPTSKKR